MPKWQEWVKLFNTHDLYTKRDEPYTSSELSEMRSYYSSLVDRLSAPASPYYTDHYYTD